MSELPQVGAVYHPQGCPGTEFWECVVSSNKVVTTRKFNGQESHHPAVRWSAEKWVRVLPVPQPAPEPGDASVGAVCDHVDATMRADDRAAFEKWAKTANTGWSLSMRKTRGGYYYDATRLAFAAWCAAKRIEVPTC